MELRLAETLRSTSVVHSMTFATIFPDIVPSNWPPSRQFLSIAKAAGGLFAFAHTIMRFIGDDEVYGDPVKQLNAAVSILDFHGHKSSDSNPLYSLDILYAYILSAVPADSLPTLNSILGFTSFVGAPLLSRYF